MARTLKERYEVRLLKEKVAIVDKQMLEEARVAALLVEAMDQDDLDKVTALVQKLEMIKKASAGQLEPLTAGIEKAQAELNKYTAGGPIAKAWVKLKGKVGVDNPIVKITTFINALERGFGQIPQILKNNGIDEKMLSQVNIDGAAVDPKSVKLSDAIAFAPNNKNEATSKGVNQLNEKETAPNTMRSPRVGKPRDNDDAPNLSSLTKNANKRLQTSKSQKSNYEKAKSAGVIDKHSPVDRQAAYDIDDEKQQDDKNAKNISKTKLDSVIKQIRTALAPGGVFGAFKKVPYVDTNQLAQALADARVSTLFQIAKVVKSGPQSGELERDMKQNIVGRGSVETKNATPAQNAQPAAQANSGKPTTSTSGTSNTTPTGETPPGDRGGGSEEQSAVSKYPILAKVFDDVGIKDSKTIFKIMNGLHKAGMLSVDKLK